MASPIKIAIVGGGFGRKVALPVYQRLDQFEPVTDWSRHADRAREVAQEAGLSLGTSDLEELLSLPGVEAVHIATPVAAHADYEVRPAARRARLVELAREVVGRPRLASVSLVHLDHAHPDSRSYTWAHDLALERVALNLWAAVREGAPPDPSVEQGLRMQAVFDAAGRADRERR
jgi:predicted dehydrogenase